MTLHPDIQAVIEGRSQWCVVTGDCLQILPTIPAGSVGAVVTDPPYGTGAWIRPESGAGSDCRAVHSLEEWDTWDQRWLEDADRLAGGRVGLFCAQVNLPHVFSWICGRQWRLCVWTKTDPRPRFGGQPAYAFECFVAVGGVQACSGTDVVMASSPRLNRDADGTGHPHQKPIEAAVWAVEIVAPAAALVLDPFTGSGTTGVAAIQSGRRFIGIEIDEKYAQIARRRIADAAPLFVKPPTATNPALFGDEP